MKEPFVTCYGVTQMNDLDLMSAQEEQDGLSDKYKINLF